MSDATEERDLDPELSATEVAAGAETIVQKIARRREQRDGTETFDIPTWDGDLRAKYQVLPKQEIQAMIRRARAAQNGGASAGSDADCDFLIQACVGILAYDPDSGEELTIAEGYTMDLAAMLDPRYPKGHPQEGDPVRITNPRELVVYMFRWQGVTLTAHAQTIGRWMQNPKREFAEDPQ